MEKRILKVLALVFSFCFLSGMAFSGEPEMPGVKTNLSEFYKANEALYDKEVVYHIYYDWPEVDVLGKGSGDGKLPNVLFLQAGEDTPFILIGVDFGDTRKGRFMFDHIGDGLLDVRTNRFMIPPWALLEGNVKKDKDVRFMEMLDFYYQAYQSNEGLEKNNPFWAKGEYLLKSSLKDPDIGNIDLYNAFHFYTVMNQDEKFPALVNILNLFAAVQERYEIDHPLLMLFIVESFLNMGQIEYARDMLSSLLKEDPGCIPGLVYDMRVEADENRKAEKENLLKKKYHDHWIVKFELGL